MPFGAGPSRVSVGARFSPQIHRDGEEYAQLNEGDVKGPRFPARGSCVRTTPTFTPGEPLKPATTYVIHVGGG